MPNCQTCKCLPVCGLILEFTTLVRNYPTKLVDHMTGLLPTSDLPMIIGEFLATRLCGNYVPEEG